MLIILLNGSAEGRRARQASPRDGRGEGGGLDQHEIAEIALKNSPYVLTLIAAVQGAAGVILAGAAAHLENAAHLSTASLFLMTHAPAGLALAALLSGGVDASRAFAAAGFALQAGVTLFSADLAARALGSGRLFPYAAPIGGSLTIAAWIALAAIAAVTLAGRAQKR